MMSIFGVWVYSNIYNIYAVWVYICINMYKFMQSGYIHIYIIYIQSRYILIPIKVLCLWTKQNACLLHAVKYCKNDLKI